MIREIYAVEISGVCNFACDYCPYHLHQRERGLMSWETLERVIWWKRENRLTYSDPLHLHLFGEPMKHPEFERMALKVKEVWGPVSFSTNGSLITPQRAALIAEVGFEWVTISPHDKQAANTAYYLLKAAGQRVEWHEGPDHCWAGQVEHPVLWRGICQFAALNQVVVRWNGDVALCCITDSAEGVIGTVWDDDLPKKSHKPFSLCGKCHVERSNHEDNDVPLDKGTLSPGELRGHKRQALRDVQPGSGIPKNSTGKKGKGAK